MSISLDEWESNPVIYDCVRLTKIQNEIALLEIEQKMLMRDLKAKDELTFYRYQALPSSDKQHFIRLDSSVKQQRAEQK